ncbi:ABC transporter substrate-binding protein [Terrihabitans sp. B22-R8]|uniref:ABC transporter substrate-binding protein n=1 Tax=Terrihabitans sp. B22-R8 TaxID=3425128 RepID=UPI00403CF85F
MAAFRIRSLGVLLAALIAVPASAQTLEKVKIGLAIPPSVTEGSIQAIARELKLFEDEKLDVEYVVLPGAGALLPQLLQRNITLALPLPETLLSAHKPGQPPLPVTYVYNAGPRNSLEIAVKADSKIQTLSDLKGGSIGVGALTWGTIPQTRALLRSVGLEPGKDVQIVAVGVLGSGFHALREDRVQALNFNSTWIDLLENEGTPARRLEFPPVFRQMIVNGYLAHRSTLESNPALLERFGRAWTKALVVCDTNPRACIEAFWRSNPAARPQGDTAAALETNVRLLQRWIEPLVRDAEGKLRTPGAYDYDIIRAYITEMRRYGELATDDIPVEDYFTNALVPAFSQFDRAALEARARELK